MKHTCFVSLTFFFRDEFLLLKKHMFDKLKVPQRSYLKVPVLFMTATANMAILKRLSRYRNLLHTDGMLQSQGGPLGPLRGRFPL